MKCSLSIKLPNKVEKFCISTLYRPPSASVNFFDNFRTMLHRLSLHHFSNFVLVGDIISARRVRTFQDYVIFLILLQVVQCPTRSTDDMHHSLIDLALLSDHTLLQRCDSK